MSKPTCTSTRPGLTCATCAGEDVNNEQRQDVRQMRPDLLRERRGLVDLFRDHETAPRRRLPLYRVGRAGCLRQVHEREHGLTPRVAIPAAPAGADPGLYEQ